jgi:putative transposase
MSNPSGAWVTQQARNLGLDLADEGTCLPSRDRDRNYSGTFDEDFASNGIRSVKPPVRAPHRQTQSRSGRQDRSRRMSGLAADRQPPPPRTRASRLRLAHNTQRPHRSLNLQPPQGAEPAQRAEPPPTPAVDEIGRHDRLVGLIHDYYRDAA